MALFLYAEDCLKYFFGHFKFFNQFLKSDEKYFWNVGLYFVVSDEDGLKY